MKKIKMQLFGNFKLDNGKNVLEEDDFHSDKSIHLLVYLLLNRNMILSVHQLIDIFWADDTKDPVGALRNMMYRLRNEMKVLGDERFICTLPSAYRWNPEIEVETDYERFEKMAAISKVTEDPVQKEKLCREIISLYRKNLTAKVADEPWIHQMVTSYLSIYLDAVEWLCEILRKEEKWEEIELLCAQAMSASPLDEDIHCLLLMAFHGQKKYDMVMDQYEKAKRLFYGNMGIQVPEKLRNTFREIMSENGEELTDIGNLLEEAREHEPPKHVFFCDYQIFRQIYRIDSRRVERLGIDEFVVLFTLRRRNNIQRITGMTSGLIEGMDILEHSISNSLRIGDVAAKYSPTQILVLLPMCTYEAGVKVAKRVQRIFRKNIGNKKLELDYELAELLAPNNS